jgi:hypothetical protein
VNKNHQNRSPQKNRTPQVACKDTKLTRRSPNHPPTTPYKIPATSTPAKKRSKRGIGESDKGFSRI